jgi:Asp-tRNA(Asn)/Glu-tRNA(Gln) amidotransferase B subunit
VRRMSARGNHFGEVVIWIVEDIVSIIRRKFWYYQATEISGSSLENIIATVEEGRCSRSLCAFEPTIMLFRFRHEDVS